jgi:uncharacterized protein YndB with AHSA1/START domain
LSDRARITGHLIRRTVHIAVPRARVWEALTDPDLLTQWFGDGVGFTALEVGGTGSIDWDDYGSFPIEFTEVEALEALGFRWSGIPADQLDEYSTHVRFTLADAASAEGAEGTEITVVETGFESLPGGTRYRRDRLEQNREGWDVELDELAMLLEND